MRQPGKAPNYSVNWTIGNTGPEIIDAMKGKGQDSGVASRLSKGSFFRRWTSLVSADVLKPLLSGSDGQKCADVNVQYNEAKESMKSFQLAKNQLYQVRQGCTTVKHF